MYFILWLLAPDILPYPYDLPIIAKLGMLWIDTFFSYLLVCKFKPNFYNCKHILEKKYTGMECKKCKSFFPYVSGVLHSEMSDLEEGEFILTAYQYEK